jgi:ArsR family transcriptional regulator, arsenate/arsenite/antimonite-responsive transcriptional repressor
MDDEAAMRMLAALAHPTRMRIAKLLIAAPAGLPSGGIADGLGVPRNLMSSHLTVLQKAGALMVSKAGRSRIWQIRLEAVLELSNHLRRLAG